VTNVSVFVHESIFPEREIISGVDGVYVYVLDDAINEVELES